jgi:hypothetical protein
MNISDIRLISIEGEVPHNVAGNLHGITANAIAVPAEEVPANADGHFFSFVTVEVRYSVVEENTDTNNFDMAQPLMKIKVLIETDQRPTKSGETAAFLLQAIAPFVRQTFGTLTGMMRLPAIPFDPEASKKN